MGSATENKMKTGAKAPDFKNLKGVDGNLHSLSDYSHNKVLIVIFACNHCPYVQAYEDRVVKLQHDFKDQGVQFVVINSNDDSKYTDDNYDSMVQRAKNKSFNFDYLKDDSQDVARAYGATHTPQIFVFNDQRQLSYTGRIDDNWENPAEVNKQYLREAIQNLINGKKPDPAETFAIGCTIKWK